MAASFIGAVFRWWRSYPRWVAVAVVAIVAGRVGDRAVLVVAGVCWLLMPSLVSVVWRRRSPHTYERYVAGPHRRFGWRRWFARSWPAVSQAVGLGRSREVTKRTKDGATTTQKVWKAAGAKVKTHPLGMSVTIRTPLGMTVAQVLDAGEALAAAASAFSVRARAVSPSLALIELTMLDVLSVLRTSAEPVLSGPVVLGRNEDGTEFVWSPYDDASIALQGMTRSGKSVSCYTLLGGLAPRPDVIVCGVDPSGILLGPWRDGRGGAWVATGTADMPRAAAVMKAIVAEMDRRIGVLDGLGIDKIEKFTAGMPVLVVVAEEYPGLLSAARADDGAQGRSGAEKVAPSIEASNGRLVKEGAKVGVRVVTIAQRMSAKAVDTDDRSNYSHRLTHRVDNSDAVRMLHDGADTLGREVREFKPGQALVESSATPLQRARMDLTTHQVYRRRVAHGIAAVAGRGFVAAALADADVAAAPSAPNVKGPCAVPAAAGAGPEVVIDLTKTSGAVQSEATSDLGEPGTPGAVPSQSKRPRQARQPRQPRAPRATP